MNSAQNLSSSRLMSKNVKIRIYETVVLYRCGTWSLTLREKNVLGMLEHTALRRIFLLQMDEIMKARITCSLHTKYN
jgi:hypothetical protein